MEKSFAFYKIFEFQDPGLIILQNAAIIILSLCLLSVGVIMDQCLIMSIPFINQQCAVCLKCHLAIDRKPLLF